MATKNGRGFLTKWFSREQPWQEITGYYAGDIHSDQPVRIMASGVIAGNVIAPKISVLGLLYGFALSKELIIQRGGQIWGDVYAVCCQIEPGGQLHGWVSTLSESEFGQFSDNQGLVEGLPTVGQMVFPAGELQKIVLPSQLAELQQQWQEEMGRSGQNRLALLTHWQSETAVALVARTELENNFEQRLTEIAGDAFAQASNLNELTQALRQEQHDLQQKLVETQDSLSGRDATISQQTDDIHHLRNQLDEQMLLLQQLQASYDEQSLLLEQTRAFSENQENQLKQALSRAEEFGNRAQNLEGALQASLQHSADQEGSLLRWQELAEVTQRRVEELQRQLDTAQAQIKENGRVIELLREQRAKLEATLQQSHAELETLYKQPVLQTQIQVPAPPEQNQQALAALREETSQLLALSDQQIARLEYQLEEMEQATQEAQGQFLWHKAAYVMTMRRSQDQERLLNDQLREIDRLQQELEASQLLAENWKGSVGKMVEMFYGQEKRVFQLENEIETLKATLVEQQQTTAQFQGVQQQIDTLQQNLRDKDAEIVKIRSGLAQEHSNLRDLLRQRNLQLEAMENEANRYHAELEAQGQRLAELRTTMVENEIAFRELQEVAEARLQENKKIRQSAAQYIKNLEGELTRSQQQLKDLMNVVERRRGREGNSSPAK